MLCYHWIRDFGIGMLPARHGRWLRGGVRMEEMMEMNARAKDVLGKVENGCIGMVSHVGNVVPSLSDLGMDEETEDTIVGAVVLTLSAIGLVTVGVLVGKAVCALRR